MPVAGIARAHKISVRAYFVDLATAADAETLADQLLLLIELVTPLAERGIDLSASQVHRLVTGTPERLSLPVLAALCDIFTITPDVLINTTAENAAPRRTATDDAAVVDMAATMRPRRAQIRPEQ